IPQLVAGLVHPVLRELDGKAAARRAVEAGKKAFDDAFGNDFESAQLGDLEGVEQVETWATLDGDGTLHGGVTRRGVERRRQSAAGVVDNVREPPALPDSPMPYYVSSYADAPFWHTTCCLPRDPPRTPRSCSFSSRWDGCCLAASTRFRFLQTRSLPQAPTRPWHLVWQYGPTATTPMLGEMAPTFS